MIVEVPDRESRILIAKITTTRLALKLTAALLLLGAAAQSACEKPHQLEVLEDKESPGVVDLYVPPPAVLDATVFVETSADNMESSRPPSFTFDLRDYRNRRDPFPVAHMQRLNPTMPFSYHFNYHYSVGNLGGRLDGSIYRLPYQDGETHRVAQGYLGNFSHQAGTRDEYAIDFSMPVGTTVLAARAGTVIGVRVDSNDGGPGEAFKECANFVVLRHSDGSYAEYVHLKQNGSLVRLGQLVQEGQPVGLSGQTGRANGPHLHFAVYVPRDSFTRQTYPTRFRTSQGVVDQLQQGQTY